MRSHSFSPSLPPPSLSLSPIPYLFHTNSRLNLGNSALRRECDFHLALCFELAWILQNEWGTVTDMRFSNVFAARHKTHKHSTFSITRRKCENLAWECRCSNGKLCLAMNKSNNAIIHVSGSLTNNGHVHISHCLDKQQFTNTAALVCRRE